ncbi:hypothetical protein MLD38_039850 [Melastoma candidum]|uniref:Uncharacterized protein n=1 Tax=Melastoma candidum TaxID=119954 RepID=A0ACB9L445_9MYRT|nr:hypothetical protein MLD38_039850 [Melastoma candidum]
MSLRYLVRFLYQTTTRAVQAYSSSALKDSPHKARLLTGVGAGAADSHAAAAPRDKQRRRRAAEESLRLVMFLSVWGPNS